jgi:hypothetical protein
MARSVGRDALTTPDPIATCRAGRDLIPGRAPLLAPGKGALADHAGFFGKIRFLMSHNAIAMQTGVCGGMLVLCSAFVKIRGGR